LRLNGLRTEVAGRSGARREIVELRSDRGQPRREVHAVARVDRDAAFVLVQLNPPAVEFQFMQPRISAWRRGPQRRLRRQLDSVDGLEEIDVAALEALPRPELAHALRQFFEAGRAKNHVQALVVDGADDFVAIAHDRPSSKRSPPALHTTPRRRRGSVAEAGGKSVL
jgi:hypothetical protein